MNVNDYPDGIFLATSRDRGDPKAKAFTTRPSIDEEVYEEPSETWETTSQPLAGFTELASHRQMAPRTIVRRRLARGRKVLLENPWTSEFWDSFHMKNLMEERLYDNESLQPLELVRGDQCMFGLRDHFNGELHYKPTLDSQKEVKELNVRCDRSHQHQHLEGGQRTKKAQERPPQLCQAMINGFLNELENHNLSAASLPP